MPATDQRVLGSKQSVLPNRHEEGASQLEKPFWGSVQVPLFLVLKISIPGNSVLWSNAWNRSPGMDAEIRLQLWCWSSSLSGSAGETGRHRDRGIENKRDRETVPALSLSKTSFQFRAALLPAWNIRPTSGHLQIFAFSQTKDAQWKKHWHFFTTYRLLEQQFPVILPRFGSTPSFLVFSFVTGSKWKNLECSKIYLFG